MTQAMVLEIVNKALYIALVVSLPIMLGALIIGLLVSLFQALTSLQDQTLSFVPKIIAVMLLAGLLFGWMSSQLVNFFVEILTMMPIWIRGG